MVKLTVNDSNINSNSILSQSQQSTIQQEAMITVYLAYAEDEKRQHYLTLKVRSGTTLYEALEKAGWLTKFKELGRWCEEVVDVITPTAKRWYVGIYAQKQPLSYQLQSSDRIEVYRSLSADPMSQRKNKSRG